MLSWIFRVDDITLHWFERFAHFLQKWIGLSTITWARISLVIASLMAGFSSSSLIIQASIGINLLATFIRATTSSNTASFEQLPYRKVFRFLACLFAVAVLPEDVMNLDLWFEVWLTYLFFIACNDRPGQKSKLKAFLESLSTNSVGDNGLHHPVVR